MLVIKWKDFLDSERSSDFYDKETAISIGSFDGPHKGHFAIFEKVLDFAKKNGTLSGLLTFEKPVSSIKQGENYNGDITSLDERLKIFEKLGFDFVIVCRFDESFSEIEGNEFFNILRDKLNLKFICEGEDFRCGKKGLYSKTEITSYCVENNIQFCFIPLISEDGKRISSTFIRDLLKNKFFDKARQLMTRK